MMERAIPAYQNKNPKKPISITSFNVPPILISRNAPTWLMQ